VFANQSQNADVVRHNTKRTAVS